MTHNPDDPLENIGSNNKMQVGAAAPKTPKARKDKKAKKAKDKSTPFMSGTRSEKSDDMESVAGGLKGAQMLIKTLFPSDEPIPRR